MLAALVRERERVTEALHTSQHRYRLATTAGGVAVWDWTLSTNELYVDDPIRAALGYAGDEIGNQVTRVAEAASSRRCGADQPSRHCSCSTARRRRSRPSIA